MYVSLLVVAPGCSAADCDCTYSLVLYARRMLGCSGRGLSAGGACPYRLPCSGWVGLGGGVECWLVDGAGCGG